jgi:hypothetical protein
MTAESLRHYCRNQKCRTKLSAPIDNHHKAFCTPSCFNQFYRWRCKVCEKDLPKEGRPRNCCRSAKCRSEFRRYRDAFTYSKSLEPIQGSAPRTLDLRSARNTVTKMALRPPYRGGIFGPKGLIQAAVIDCREWHEVISTEGVAAYVSRITTRALRDGGAS